MTTRKLSAPWSTVHKVSMTTPLYKEAHKEARNGNHLVAPHDII